MGTPGEVLERPPGTIYISEREAVSTVCLGQLRAGLRCLHAEVNPSARRLAGAGRLSPNRLFLPRALREAIPNLPTCIGRDLELEAVSGTVANAIFEGKCIQLELLGAETGKLRGKFPLRISLSVEAARALAESLKKLADQAENTAFQA